MEDYEKKYKEALENFVDIQGYEGFYKINTSGDVLSVRSGKLLKAGKNKQGYMNVALSKDGKAKTHKVHRLVALAFISNPNNYPFINHKDENKTNNRVENLEWCTSKYNLNYGTAIERRSESIKNSSLKQRKAVLQLSLTGDVVGEYISTKEASEATGIDRRQISRSINHLGKQAHGFLWVLKENYNNKIDYAKIWEKESIHPKPKRIAQYTKDGEFVKEWDSLKEAHLNLGINYSSLTNCLCGRYSHAGGFIWKFI